MYSHADSQKKTSLITGSCPQFCCQHPGPTAKALGTAVVSVWLGMKKVLHLLCGCRGLHGGEMGIWRGANHRLKMGEVSANGVKHIAVLSLATLTFLSQY